MRKCSTCPEGYPDEWGHHPVCKKWADSYFDKRDRRVHKVNVMYEIILFVEVMAIVVSLMLLCFGL